MFVHHHGQLIATQVIADNRELWEQCEQVGEGNRALSSTESSSHLPTGGGDQEPFALLKFAQKEMKDRRHAHNHKPHHF